MPTALPIIRGSSTALYPFKQIYLAHTSISDGQAATPARCPTSPPTMRFEFGYPIVSQSQKNTLKGAYLSALGQFATDRTVGLGSTTFTDLSFDDDTFSAIERSSGLYNSGWTLSQSLPQNWSPAASGGAFPVNSLSAICQLPYTQRVRYQTVVSKMESGPKYTYAEFGGARPGGGALAGFPQIGSPNAGTPGLMAWELGNGMLNDSEVSTLVNHFLANWGDAFPFSFTDEDGTVYSNVYYASPQLEITRNMVNMSSVQLALIQMN